MAFPTLSTLPLISPFEETSVPDHLLSAYFFRDMIEQNVMIGGRKSYVNRAEF